MTKTAETGKTRPLSSYRPQHDDNCRARHGGCEHCDWLPGHIHDDHWRMHAFEPAVCTYGLDAALAAEAQKDAEIARLRAEVEEVIKVARSAGCYFYCEACRAAGHVHCSEADRCTGMKLLPPRAKSEATLPPCVNGECLYSCADDECKKAAEKGLPWPPVAAEAAPQVQNDDSAGGPNTREVGPYLVEVDNGGCACCGADKTWTVVGPDGVAHSQSWMNPEDAEAFASALNEAFCLGVASAPARQHHADE